MTRPNEPEDVWRHVDRRPHDECWPCSLRPNTSGYGQFSLKGRMVLAHRVVFMLTHGRWPQPCCLHRRDNRSCCNPAHLFEGTQQQNVADMMAKGRNRQVGTSNPRPGELNPNCKLTDAQVRDIRAHWATRRITQAALAQCYGVCAKTVGVIVRNEARVAANA